MILGATATMLPARTRLKSCSARDDPGFSFCAPTSGRSSDSTQLPVPIKKAQFLSLTRSALSRCRRSAFGPPQQNAPLPATNQHRAHDSKPLFETARISPHHRRAAKCSSPLGVWRIHFVVINEPLLSSYVGCNRIRHA